MASGGALEQNMLLIPNRSTATITKAKRIRQTTVVAVHRQVGIGGTKLQPAMLDPGGQAPLNKRRPHAQAAMNTPKRKNSVLRTQ